LKEIMKSLKFNLSLVFAVLFAVTASAQTGSITTAGTDCSVSTRCVIFPVARGSQTVTVNLAGNATGQTALFEFTPDNGNGDPTGTTHWYALSMNDVINRTTGNTSATSNSFFVTPNYNFTHVRIRATAISSGSIDIKWDQGSQSSATGASSPSGGLTNLTQLNGNTVSTNSGTADAGTQRFVPASNSPALSTKCVDSGGSDCTDTVNHAQKVTVVASSIAGATPVIKSALAATVFTVASGASIIDSMICFNPHASADAYVQMFNTTSSVTLGTTVPDAFIPCPHAQNCGGTNINWNFGTGWKVAATTTSTGSTGATTALECTFGKR
jgi:hypothetical protein